MKNVKVVIVLFALIAVVGVSAVYLLDTWTPTPPTTPTDPFAPSTPGPSTPADPTQPSTPPPEPYDGGPILIKGDDQFTLTNGVVSGSGTQADPYIIEGWDIDVSRCDTSVWPGVKVGIIIFDTSKHFVVRNCQVENAETNVGISLSFASYGRVEDCVIRNSYNGISVDNSFNVTISGNTIESCENGISGGSYGSWCVNIFNNTVTECADVGIDFFNLCNSSATGNIVNNNFNGIRVFQSANATISYNTVQGNKHGIDVSYSGWRKDNNIIAYNDVSNNVGTGISVTGSNDFIIYNTVNGNGDFGIRLDFIGLTDTTAGNNVVSNNTVCNNVCTGIILFSGCVQNTVSNNICLSNNADGQYYADGSPRYYDIDIGAMPNTLENNTYGTIYIYNP